MIEHIRIKVELAGFRICDFGRLLRRTWASSNDLTFAADTLTTRTRGLRRTVHHRIALGTHRASRPLEAAIPLMIIRTALGAL